MKKAQILELIANNLQVPFVASPNTPYMDPINIENLILPLTNELFPATIEDSQIISLHTLPTNPSQIQYNIRFTKRGNRVHVEGWVINRTGTLLTNTDIFYFKTPSEFRPDDSVFSSQTIFRGEGIRIHDEARVRLLILADGSSPKMRVSGNFSSMGTGIADNYKFNFQFSYNAKPS